MKNKIILTVILIILIILTIFLIFYYKNSKIGNTTINKSEEQIVQDILNISKYKAKLEIEIQTNKNKTKYVITQEANKAERKQEVLEPENIQGLTIEYKENQLTIDNSKLQLNKVYENYKSIVDNNLWLGSFIADYQKEGNIKIQDDEMVLETKSKEANQYAIYKKLYIDKKTGKPTKLTVQDVNQKTLVYILYTEIEIS